MSICVELTRSTLQKERLTSGIASRGSLQSLSFIYGSRAFSLDLCSAYNMDMDLMDTDNINYRHVAVVIKGPLGFGFALGENIIIIA